MKRYRAANPDYVARGRSTARTHRAKNKEKYLADAISRQANGRQFINTFKNEPCADCGNSYPPYVMDFDHVRGDKIANIGEMGTYSLETILAEIAKCDLVCSNCHRIRTHNRS